MIHTEMGDYPSFALLRAAYLAAAGDSVNLTRYYNVDEWDDNTLHISDLGKCERQQMLRLSGAPKKLVTPEKQANDALMFWQGNMIHALTVAAADWAGIALAYEDQLPDLPEGWSGHFDLSFYQPNFSPILWDGKTVRPNAFRYWYDWPKIEARRQMQGYLRFTNAELGLVEYIDRGGSNTPWLCDIQRDDEWVDYRIGILEAHRSLLPELPPPLSPEYKLNYYKDRNLPSVSINSVVYQHSWQCDWCDYCWSTQVGTKTEPEWVIHEDSPCHPRMLSLPVAKMSKGKLTILRADHEAGVHRRLEHATRTFYDPRAEGTLEGQQEALVVE